MTHDPFKRFARLFSKGKGRETVADAANRLKLYHLVLDVALDAVSATAQTMRRIYYLCSGQGMIPKGLKGERFIKNAMSTARWDGHLPWELLVRRAGPVVFQVEEKLTFDLPPEAVAHLGNYLRDAHRSSDYRKVLSDTLRILRREVPSSLIGAQSELHRPSRTVIAL